VKAARLVPPAIVLIVAIAGAHPFCNLAFHCGCDVVALTAHCNIHDAQPPHCPWCARPIYFALSALFALAVAAAALRAVARRGVGARLAAGLVGLVGGATLAAWITAATYIRR
jgi:hypothetical protein